MSGDNLSIIMFFASLAVTFAMAGMNQAGWKPRALISSLFVLAAISAATAAAWPWAKDYSPFAATYVREIATSPVAWFIVVMFALASAAFPQWQTGHRLARAFDGTTSNTPNAIATSGASNINPRLTIDVGYGPPFKVMENIPNGFHQVVSVSVRNAGQTLLTNCALYIENIEPSSINPGPILLTPQRFSLTENDHRLVPIAVYDRWGGDGDRRGVFQICAAPAPAYGGGIIRLATGAYRMTLRAVSTETPPSDLLVTVLVDDQNQLWLERLRPPG